MLFPRIIVMLPRSLARPYRLETLSQPSQVCLEESAVDISRSTSLHLTTTTTTTTITTTTNTNTNTNTIT